MGMKYYKLEGPERNNGLPEVGLGRSDADSRTARYASRQPGCPGQAQGQLM